jgi:hemolysin D
MNAIAATFTSWRDSLARIRDIVSAALAMEKEQAATAKRYGETEFLPAVLEVTETPPSPQARLLLWGMTALVGVALLWSILGRVDVVAVASGKIIPQERVKLVQWGGMGEPGLTGVIKAIHVREGQQVKAGEALIELDPTFVGAAGEQASRGFLSAQIEQARTRAILRYLNGGGLSFQAPADTPADVASTQRQLLSSTIAEYEADRARLNAERDQREAEAAAAADEMKKLQDSLPLLEKQEAARRELAEQGYGSKLLMWQTQEALVERRQQIAIQRSNMARARAAIAGIDKQLAQARQELTRTSLAGMAQAEEDASVRKEELRKSETRKTLQTIRAPVDGAVTQLQLHTIGGVIQPAQTLMAIVPKDSALIVEAQVANKDIGFVRAGQAVQIKLEAYPFTTHGMLDGTVEGISADAVLQPPPPTTGQDPNDQRQAEAGGRQTSGGLMFMARVKLDPKSVAAFSERLCGAASAGLSAGDQPTSPRARLCEEGALLTPGMSATAEIKTAQRRIIQYLLSPLRQTAQEAGRER